MQIIGKKKNHWKKIKINSKIDTFGKKKKKSETSFCEKKKKTGINKKLQTSVNTGEVIKFCSCEQIF